MKVKDYVLYDNKWLILMSKEKYARYVKNYNHPKGGKPWSRELLATFEYDHAMVQKSGFTNAITMGGSGALVVQILEKSKLKYTPLGIFATFIFGQANAYDEMQQRMKQHDDMVDFYRK